MVERVTVVGSVNMDLVATTSTLPRPGETVLGRGFRAAPGGKGANQAVAVARAGAECAFVGAVGDDGFGPELRAALSDAGMRIDGLRTVSGPSGVALIAVDDTGENLIVVAPGANAAVTELTRADRELITGADVLLLQLEVPLPAVIAAAREARAAGVPVILNAAPAMPLPDDLLGSVDLLVVNESEAATLAGESAGQGPAGLLDLLPRVVLTLGARGAAYADREGARLDVPAPRITAVDATAAGDAFTGALAVAWAQQRPMAEALRWACAAGAACAQRPGAVTAIPTRAEIDALAASS